MIATKTRAPVFLLGLGNRKLGDLVHTFSLPAVHTCPGRSRLCEKACYARRGHLAMQRKRYDIRLRMSRRRDFVDRMAREIQLRGCRLVRIHVAGDFYSADYVEKWAQILKKCPRVRFFCYTRSWRVPAIRPSLDRLSAMPNIRLWYSADRETNLPTNLGRKVRVAYMALDDQDVPEVRPDLVFRVKRKTVQKRSNGVLVCPSENGTTKTSCQSCGLCWEPIRDKDPRRFALSVL